jgi:hypothetical protein
LQQRKRTRLEVRFGNHPLQHGLEKKTRVIVNLLTLVPPFYYIDLKNSKKMAEESLFKVYAYECVWSKVKEQCVRGGNLDAFRQRSWILWIPKKSKRESMAVGVHGYQGNLMFSFEDLKICHYEFMDDDRLGNYRGYKAFGLWELKDGRWIMIWATFTTQSWWWDTMSVHRYMSDSLVKLVRFGVTEYQRECFEIVLLNQGKVISVLEVDCLLYSDLSHLILEYLENYELGDTGCPTLLQ